MILLPLKDTTAATPSWRRPAGRRGDAPRDSAASTSTGTPWRAADRADPGVVGDLAEQVDRDDGGDVRAAADLVLDRLLEQRRVEVAASRRSRRRPASHRCR